MFIHCWYPFHWDVQTLRVSFAKFVDDFSINKCCFIFSHSSKRDIYIYSNPYYISIRAFKCNIILPFKSLSENRVPPKFHVVFIMFTKIYSSYLVTMGYPLILDKPISWLRVLQSRIDININILWYPIVSYCKPIHFYYAYSKSYCIPIVVCSIP
jgi:hypothetical protein